ncbi:MAG: DUF2510 domain-containing protein [Propionibacteriaceae bacterium]|nr:DUF2510 domain-containing protein [Propionibacteriaceae bacterium]
MQQAGWYPDPAGMPGLFRYWDGAAWTTAVTNNPPAGQPVSGPAQQPAPVYTPPPQAANYLVRNVNPNAAPVSAYPEYYQQPKSSKAWWIVLVAVVLVLAVGIWFVVANPGNWTGAGGSNPIGTPSVDTCPKIPETNDELKPREEGGRVYGGLMSYEKLPSPWEGVTWDSRAAYSYLVGGQWYINEYGYDGYHDWGASVLIGELAVGDGFASPQQGAELLFQCIIGEFYHDNEITVATQTGAAHTVSGHTGWMVDATITFSAVGLEATGEQVKVFVIPTSDTRWSLFYTSVPNNFPEAEPGVEAAIASLQVDE